jgi:simple sugar transport system permease protein
MASKQSLKTQIINPWFGPFVGLLVILMTGILLNGRTFISLYNQLNVLSRISIIALPSIGMTLVVLTGGIDLSIGSLVSLSSVCTAMLLMERQWNRSTSIVIPVVMLFTFLIVFTSIRRITKRFSLSDTSGKLIGMMFGIVLSVLVLFWSIQTIPSGFPTWAVLVFVPMLGAFLGMVNGLIISKAKIQPFIVTLGMMSSAVGLAKFIAGKGGQIHPLYYKTENVAAMGSSISAPLSFDNLSGTLSIFDVRIVPTPVFFFLFSFLLVHFISRRMVIGRHIIAVGGNETTAFLSGVDVDRIKLIVYGITGSLSALAGVLYCSAYTQGKPDAGATWELDTIAAVVIGGTSLKGGKGTVRGTVIGILIMGYLNNIMNLQGVPGEVQDILKGLIIVGAVIAQESLFDTLTNFFLRWKEKKRQ